jgi:hypothetical protein
MSLNNNKSTHPNPSKVKSAPPPAITLTHGITPHTLALSTEDPTALRRHVNTYLDLYAPTNQVEMDLVAILISTSWRLRRAWRTESALHDCQMVDDRSALDAKYKTSVDSQVRTGLAFKSLCDTSTAWRNLDRYESRLVRMHHTALTDLQSLQKERRMQNEPTNSPIFNTPPSA